MPAKSSAIDRDAKFIQTWADTGFDPDKKNDCAQLAGFSPRAATRTTGRIISSLIQNQKMQKALKKKGVNMERLAQKISELLEAKNYLIKPRIDPFSQQLVYAPDNFTQLKATELATRLHDAFAPTRVDIDKRETKQVVMTAEVIHRLERFNSQTEKMKLAEAFVVEPLADQQG